MENNIFVNTEATQINLFDVLKNMGQIKMVKKEYSSELPENVKSMTGTKSFSELAGFLKTTTGKSYVMIYKGNRYAHLSHSDPEYYDYTGESQRGSELRVADAYTKSASVMFNICLHKGRDIYKSILQYATETGDVYEAEAVFKMKKNGYPATSYYIEGNVSISKWKKAKLHAHRITTVLNQEDVPEILKRVNPYAAEFIKHYNTLNDIDLLIAPQIEQLDKAGYSFVKQQVMVALTGYEDSASLEQFNRLCQPGKNMKEIFKTSKVVYTTLRGCDKLSIWDVYRKMDKQGKISADAIERAYNNNYSEKELNEFSTILGMEYDGKKIFTWDSLQKYIERIDMYEAIDRLEGLMLLKDYLSMCRQLEMKPRIDGDSLKREHDVTARTLRQKRDEIRAGKMVGVCEENKKYDYSEHIYFGRCIRSYDDLIDEASQQHNCVASYADRIIAKRSYIFVVREVSAPDKSLATVEITPSGKIYQKFLAYNTPILNKALTEFIERLAKNFKETKKNNVSVKVA